MTPLPQLLERVESATGGSRDLDAEIAIALQCTAGYKPEGDEKLTLGKYGEIEARDANGLLFMLPQTFAYTKSVDAATALVEKAVPPHPHAIDQDVSDVSLSFGSWGAEATIDRDSFHGERKYYGCARTPALALCAALIRAKLAESEK